MPPTIYIVFKCYGRRGNGTEPASGYGQFQGVIQNLLTEKWSTPADELTAAPYSGYGGAMPPDRS